MNNAAAARFGGGQVGLRDGLRAQPAQALGPLRMSARVVAGVVEPVGRVLEGNR